MNNNKLVIFIIFILMISMISQEIHAQNVEIETTTGGFLPPRLTTAERDAISVSLESDGLIIFNITTGRLNVYDGFLLEWLELHPGPHTISAIDYFRALPNGIQTLLDAGETPLNILNEGASISDFIGLNHAGGIIFYMDPSGNGTGLVSASTDQSPGAEWGCDGTDLMAVPNVPNPPSGPGAEIGEGSTNTTAILSVGNCPAAPAALACTNYTGGGFSDWFLPSIKEIDEMYMKIGQGATGANENIGGFADSYYWSSSEFDDNIVWTQLFSDGTQNFSIKVGISLVRAIRAF